MPGAPGDREVYFFELLLPLLHMAYQRVQADGGRPSASSDAVDLLSARELEILTWVMRGKSNFEISAILDLSTLTVKNHLQNIYRKLNVHTRVQAVSRCWDLHALGVPGIREPG
jgi:DNA-binding CsgD family transcriptional regulator